jgi:hypothetical protein
MTSIDPKILKSSEKKIKLIHTNIPFEDPIKVEINIHENQFKIFIYTDLEYKYFKLHPRGKEFSIKMGEISVWNYVFDSYIKIDSIVKEKKELFYLLSGSLIDFDETL